MWQDHLPRIINNPIIQRESLVRLRYLSSFLFLGGVLMMGYLMMLANLQSIKNFSMYMYMTYDEMVRSSFSSFNAFLFFGLSCMVPFISAGAINNEKERETWDLVATTPLNFSTIYLGKFISSIGFIWLLFFSIMPFYGLFFLAGSISFQEVFYSFVGLTEISVLLAAWGLWCSCIWKKTVQSVTAAFVISFLYLIFIPYAWLLLSMWWSGGFLSGTPPSMDVALIISPLFFMSVYVSGFSVNPNGGFELNTIIFLHYLFTLSLFLFLAGTSIFMMYFKKSHKPKEILSDENLNLKSKRVNKFMNRFLTKAGFPEDKNPVMIKDYRMMACKRWSYIPSVGLMLIAFFIVSITFFTITQSPGRNLHDDSLFWLIFVPLMILPYAGNCFRMEKDQDTFDLLLSSNIPIAKIVQGKFNAGLKVFVMRYAVCFVIFTIATFFIYVIDSSYPTDSNMGYRRQFNTIDVVLSNILIAGVFPLILAIFFLSIGMYFSAVMKHTNAAFALTFITAFLVYFGSMIGISMVQSFVIQLYNYDFIRNLYSVISPLWYMINLIYDSGSNFRIISSLNCFLIQSFLMIYVSIIFYYLTIKKLSSKAV